MNPNLGKGAEITDYSRISSYGRQPVWVKTSHDIFAVCAFELLSWQLKSLLRVKLYESVKETEKADG